MISRLFAATAILALAGTVQAQSQAQSPPDGLVWMALNEINADYFDRDDPTNRPPLVTEVPEGMLRPVDVSPDGVADWIVDFSAAGLGDFCGTGGCSRILYVSGGETGFRRAFDAQALAFNVVRRDGEARIEAQVHHLECRPGRAHCLYAWAWDETLNQLVERPAPDGVTRLEGGGFQPIEQSLRRHPDDLPPELSEAWFGGRRTCRAYTDDGVVILRSDFRTVPDLNGDGRRDWIEIPAACIEEGEPDRFRVWTTTSQGGLAMTYESDEDRYPSVDISTLPARVLVNPSCGHGEPCADTPLRWNAATATFTLSP